MRPNDRPRSPLRPRLAVEACEPRQLLTGAAGAGSVAKTLIHGLAGSVGGFAAGTLVDVGLGFALSAIGLGDNTEAKLDEIASKLDKVEVQIGELQASVDRLESKIDQATFNQVVAKIPTEAIDLALRDLNTFLSAKTLSERKVLQREVLDDIKDLRTAPGIIHNALIGAGGTTKLVSAYSAALRSSQASAPYLTSAYSADLVGVYNYYKDYEALATTLVIEYYNAKAKEAPSFHERAREEVKLAETRDVAEHQTLPKHVIPKYAVIDPRTGLAWSTFATDPGGGMEHYYAANAFLQVVRGDLAPNKHNPAALQPLAKKAHDVQMISAGGIGFAAFHWQVPTLVQVRTLKAPDPSKAVSYLTARGFNAGLVPFQVWTSDLARVRAPIQWDAFDRPIAYDTFTAQVSAIPGTDQAFNVLPSYVPRQTGRGANAMYVSATKHGEFYV